MLVELVAPTARTSIAPLFEALATPLSSYLETFGDRERRLLLDFVSHINNLVLEATIALREE